MWICCYTLKINNFGGFLRVNNKMQPIEESKSTLEELGPGSLIGESEFQAIKEKWLFEKSELGPGSLNSDSEFQAIKERWQHCTKAVCESCMHNGIRHWNRNCECYEEGDEEYDEDNHASEYDPYHLAGQDIRTLVGMIGTLIKEKEVLETVLNDTTDKLTHALGYGELLSK